MKLALITRSLIASLLLLGFSASLNGQDEAVTNDAAGYDKLPVLPEFAMLPKPRSPEDDSASSQAQYKREFREWNAGERTRRAAREEKRKLSEAAVRGGGGGPMRGYFTVIHFPLMTTNFSNTTRDRKYVRDELAEASSTARAELLPLVSDMCKKLIEGNYPPGSRVNAALLLGELNDIEAKNPTPATPHRAALKYLLDLIENPAITPDVKGAALVGVLRHVELDSLAAAGQKMPAADMDAVVTKMITLASAKDAPAEIAKPVFTYMQRRAATILGAYGQPGADAKVYNALVAIVSNDAAPLWVRCDAATSLGRLNYTDAKVDAIKGAKSLGALAAYAANDELETLKKLNESGGAIGGPGAPGGPGGGMMGGPRGGYGGGRGGMGGAGPSAPGGVGGGAPGVRGGAPGAPGAAGGFGSGGPGPGFGGGVGGGGVGGMAGGNSVYYAEPLVDAMVRRLMAALNSALIGLDGANGKNSGLRKPKQDASLDRIAENIEKLRNQLVRLQKKEDEQAEVFRDFRLAVLDMETVSGAKKKVVIEPEVKPGEPATPPPGGATGGQ